MYIVIEQELKPENMLRLFLILVLLSIFSCAGKKEEKQLKEVETVVENMNAALASHDLEELLHCYSDKLDWENSYGWTIKNKETLNKYFGQWLFPKYPELDLRRLNLKYKSEFLNTESALVDVSQQILSENKDTVLRTYRQMHILIKKGDKWFIEKSRMWAPTSHKDPPLEFLTCEGFCQ